MILFNPEMFLGIPFTTADQQIQLPYLQVV